MKRSHALLIAACLVAAACNEDPARSVKIVARPPATPAAVVAPPGAVTPRPTGEWRPAVCPPPAEASPGPSTLTVTGPCAFEHQGAFNCEARGDDFLMSMTRKAAGEATLMIYVNVEKYNGPGNYDEAQIFLSVQDKSFIYRWSSDTVSITVGDGETFAVLPTTRLEAEPLLIDCSGPMTNYQCSGRGDSAIESTTEILAGTLRCAMRGATK